MKRLLDVILAFAVLVLLAPLMGLIALAITLFIGRPVLFQQRRPGLNGRPFLMTKFRTMRDTRDAKGNLLEDRLRMTRVGQILRTSSLDELPELWNVLKGDMSLVGPRPLLMEYLPLYTQQQKRRHDVRPGVTGWAQVNGRNAISWEEKFEFDIWYVDNQNLWLDIKILWKTGIKVLKHEGIADAEHVTMPVFTGTKEQ